MPIKTFSARSPARPGAVETASVVPLGLLVFAAAGWWWSVRMAPRAGGGMDAMTGMRASLSFGAFVAGWTAMVAAMMAPAILPVARLYARAAARGRAAPTWCFLLGYLVAWTTVAGPAYVAWRALEAPLAEGRPWVARLAGATFLAAAMWQLTPVKTMCLRHCRSPLGFFLRFGAQVGRPLGAARLGATHAVFCLGCCWAIFAVLVVLGTMNIAWMIALTALIVLERSAPRGELIASAAGVAAAAVGVLLLADPSYLPRLT